MSHVDLSDFLSGFLAESEDHLRSVHTNLLLVDKAIQRAEACPRAVRELFRSLHTIKGLAGMVGVEPIVDISHAMERVLREAEQSGGRLPPRAFEPLLLGSEAIGQRLNALSAGKSVLGAPAELIAALEAIRVSSDVFESNQTIALDPALLAKLNSSEKEQLSNLLPSQRAFQVTFVPSTERAAGGITITRIRERLARLADIVKVMPLTRSNGSLSFLILLVSGSSPEELAQAAECLANEVVVIAEAQANPRAGRDFVEDSVSATSAGMLRMDVRRVDAAIDEVGELLVTKFRLARAVADLANKGIDVRELQEVTHDLQRRLRDARALVLGLRMVSLAELLDRLPILLRGLQTTTSKAVTLDIDVGHFEVDKSVGDQLWPVVVHLIRNAVDHGLEPEAERTRQGKPPQGTVVVSCKQSSNSQLELKIEDDGAGISAEQVAKRAGSKVPSDMAELLDLITRPGFSTRETATATSGRGMGLDIARRIVVNELGGELRLATTLGRGTCFSVKVPVTVAVVDTFRFESAGQAFLVPVASVEEFVQVDPSDLVFSPVLGAQPLNAALFSKRGRTMPFIELASLIHGRATPRSPKAIVVRRDEQWFAFGVDRLVDHHEVIVRRLVDPLVSVPGVAGAADLGDGKPTLLLDLIALSRVSSQTERAA